jgi:NADPH-dependent 2,4-dienoyl-CoA reductase/sulfur reductase-like enzyme
MQAGGQTDAGVPKWDGAEAPLRVVVVGGLAVGMSAATRARRMNEHASITVLEPGSQLSIASGDLPAYVSGKVKTESEPFSTTPASVAQRYRVGARIEHEVTRIDREQKRVEGVDRATGQTFTLPYDRLILALGAKAIVPGIPGVDAANVFSLQSFEDAQSLNAYLTDGVPVNAVVVGAGFSGLEAVAALSERGLNVTVIEKGAHVLPALAEEVSDRVGAELAFRAVRLLTGSGLRALHLTDGLVEAVETEAGERVATDLVLLALGSRPDTRLAEQAGLALGVSGGIRVDANFCTSDPHIYAVSEASSAARQGRSAGEHAATGHALTVPDLFGTALVRGLGLELATTGLGLDAARAAGYDADSVLVHAHADGSPRATPLLDLLIVYARESGQLLGAQAVGAKGVDKCIDVLATALHFRATVADLAALDLALPPQFWSHEEPVHDAAFTAQERERGRSKAG